MEDLKIAMHLELASSCTVERSTISAVCELYKDDVREEKLLASNGSNQRHGQTRIDLRVI